MTMGTIEIDLKTLKGMAAASRKAGTERQWMDVALEWIDGAVEEIVRQRQWVNDLQSGMYINCVYCGHRYGPSDEVPASVADVLKAHVEQCPEHPMSKLRTAAKALADDVEMAAKRSFAPGHGYAGNNWRVHWHAEDPDGYQIWKALHDALGGEDA